MAIVLSFPGCGCFKALISETTFIDYCELYFSLRTLRNMQFLNRHGFLSFQIDIFSSEVRGSALMHLSHANLNSINSLNVFHPSLNKLAGGNSSGKVYLWTE